MTAARRRVHVEWGAVGAARLAESCDVVVVCDVLSFSTVVSVAVAGGVTVYPHPWNDPRAAGRAAELGAVLAGARGTEASLAPSTFACPAGSGVVLPSPNGAMCALAADAAGAMVMSAALRNRRAVARWIDANAGTVGIVAAGERWPDGSLRPAYEDWIGAGALAALLDADSCSPEAAAAAAAFALRRPLAEVMSGVELADKGFADDVRMAEELDADDVAPLLVQGGFVDA